VRKRSPPYTTRSHRSHLLAFARSCGALVNSWIEAYLADCARHQYNLLTSLQDITFPPIRSIGIHIVFGILFAAAAAAATPSAAGFCSRSCTVQPHRLLREFFSTLLYSTCLAVYLPSDVSFSSIRHKMQGDSHSIKNPLLNVQTHSEDADPRPSRCPDCCLFPVISPSGKHVDARLHGTLLKDVPWIGAVLVTLGVLFIIIIGLMLRHHGADAPIVNVNIGQFNMIAGLMLLTWFGWGYAVCCKFFYAHDINYVVGLNLGTPPIADPSRPERYLSALGVARLTALIAVLQGLSLVMCIALWRYLHFDASAVVVFLVFLFHIFFLLIPRLFERDSRLALRSTILRCLAAPLFQVLFIDNVVGDVLTSSQGEYPLSRHR
jgi:hypothetical protein